MTPLINLQSELFRLQTRLSEQMTTARIEGDTHTYQTLKYRREGIGLALDALHNRIMNVIQEVA